MDWLGSIALLVGSIWPPEPTRFAMLALVLVVVELRGIRLSIEKGKRG